jgi:hypothetical protein
MPTTFIGTNFPQSSQWFKDEILLISKIHSQINSCYPTTNNLFINSTWFGPQFDNGQYQKFIDITQDQIFDKLFILAAVDPVFLSPAQLDDVIVKSGATETFLLGHFESAYQFNFHAAVIPKYFREYTQEDLLLKNANKIFLNYNRKPREHRIRLVGKLLEHKLTECGVVTLGQDESGIYGPSHNIALTLGETPDDYAKEGNWNLKDEFGIPHDIHSLGNMDLWQSHFLTVVSETEWRVSEPLFVSEKLWKPIIGLRPFVINGQTKIYQWLRDNGFKTFNQWFDTELENVDQDNVQDSIIEVIKYLKTQNLDNLYLKMLPDLVYNKQRFTEFFQEQRYKMDNLF